VFFTVIVVGFWKNGLHFRNFVPSGVPGYMLPLVVPIEVMSFFTRPVSHSIRLFANMLTGHITLQVFAGFVTMLGAIGLVGWLAAVLPTAVAYFCGAFQFRGVRGTIATQIGKFKGHRAWITSRRRASRGEPVRKP